MSISDALAIDEITVETLASQLQQSSPMTQLIDVREPQEVELASISGFINLPLSEFAQWSPHITERLDPHQETIVLCHHGLRSAQMCQWLINQGFTNVKNVIGGIDAYSCRVASSIPRY